MATFRSNLNSVSNTYNVSALKERLTTWFQQWRQSRLHQQQQQQTSANKQAQQKLLYSFLQQSRDHKFFSEKSSRNLKDFNTNLKNIFIFNKRAKKSTTRAKAEPAHGEKVQIVAKLLSSTLIATTTTTTTTHTEQQQQHECAFHTTAMTISENTFLTVRDEHPDIDDEIRAILMANAQDGATISQIKADYRKQTGMTFPIYTNITDFLLTIPRVTAECSEQGTRIFNIKPSKKNQHIYDMVKNQKSQADNVYNGQVCERNWRKPKRIRTNDVLPQTPYYANINKNNSLSYYADLNNNGNQNKNLNGVLSVALATQDQQTSSTDKSMHKQGFEVFVDQNLCFQDNWNYLNNRFNAGPTFRDNQICSDPLLEERQPVQYQPLLPAIDEGSAGNRIQKRRYPQSSRSSSPTITRSNSSQPLSDSLYTMNSQNEARLLDFPLLGDDFFLYMARMELKCKFKKFEKVLQSGLCASGQTIKAAHKRILNWNRSNTTIIVNIGSVDILLGRSLVHIEHDFRQLINRMHLMHIKPVLTTIAPLANFAHDRAIKEKVTRFNEFIKRECQFFTVIDIYSCLVNEHGTLRFDCYQNEPRSVTGTTLPHVFWNKIGRQRVLQMIEANLEY